MDTSRRVSCFRDVKTKKKCSDGGSECYYWRTIANCATEHNSDYEYENRDKHLVEETRTYIRRLYVLYIELYFSIINYPVLNAIIHDVGQETLNDHN